MMDLKADFQAVWRSVSALRKSIASTREDILRGLGSSLHNIEQSVYVVGVADDVAAAIVGVLDVLGVCRETVSNRKDNLHIFSAMYRFKSLLA